METIDLLERPQSLGGPPEGVTTNASARRGRTPEARPAAEFTFGDFRLLPRSRLLLRGDRPVGIGSRAFDLLHALLKSPGVVIGKGALVKEVWPSTFVDESNLRFQMACLRKALGSEREVIRTVPGRGYVFTGDCHRATLPSEPTASRLLATARSREESGPSRQLLQLPGDRPATEAGRKQDSHAVWYLASLSLARAPGTASAPAVGQAPLLARRHLDEVGRAQIELLLPMLVVGDHSEADRDQLQPPAAMEPLLVMLRAALDRGIHVHGSPGAAA